MDRHQQIAGLCRLGEFFVDFLKKEPHQYTSEEDYLAALLRKSEIENPWFTQENQRHALESWANLLTESQLNAWLSPYQLPQTNKRVGLILAGNIPMVGFHDVLAVVLSNHTAVIKPSSKDRQLLPFLMGKWKEFSGGNVKYEFVEKLDNFDAVIATGSNNTARYLEYYFKDYLSIIRKNRTSIAVLGGDETDDELKLLAEDIFRYFGLGCRNVTRLLIPENFEISRLFENFINFKEVINHHKYANNYEYNRAVYLLNQEKFWDNNFVMLKEDEQLFSPLSVINFSRYNDLGEVRAFVAEHENDIQAVVSNVDLGFETVPLGKAQQPGLSTYADHVDTMRFLEVI